MNDAFCLEIARNGRMCGGAESYMARIVKLEDDLAIAQAAIKEAGEKERARIIAIIYEQLQWGREELAESIRARGE